MNLGEFEARGLIEGTDLAFSRDSAGRLMAVDGTGKVYEDLMPLRLFPHSDPEHWIAIFDADGAELCCLNDPSRLDPASASVLEEELQSREFVPEILRIVHVSGNNVPCEWHVETDRGNTVFVITDEKDVRRLGPHNVLVVDGHGIRYLIPDYRKLDAYGRRIIEWYV